MKHSPDRRHWLAATACAAWPWPAKAAEPQYQPWPRQRATPPLQLPGLDSGGWNLSAVRGQPVLLNFWASWCEPCRAEMPSLEQLASRYQAQGLQVIAINYRETDAAVRRFIETTSLRLPVLCDRDGAAAKAFGVHAFPSTVAIGRQGQARFTIMGECDWRSVAAQRWVATLL